MSAWQNQWSVVVNGRDISSALAPVLMDITVTDKDGTSSDSLSITVDDTGGQIAMPDERASITVRLNGALVFEGVIDRVRSSGSRGGGRKISITAKGYDTKGKAKEVQAHHKDNATLGDFMKQAAGKAGFSIDVDSDLASIKRDYWSADFESFIHLGERVAREVNGTFKLRGKKAILTPRGKDKGLPTITGTFGDNLISWDITPKAGRPIYTKATARYFDRDSATYKTVDVEFSTDRPAEAANVVRTPVKDEAQAKDVGKARKSEAEREGGEGTVTLDCTPAAQAEALFVLSGARPGVDGAYRIVTVTHRGARGSGNTTTLELKQPKG